MFCLMLFIYSVNMVSRTEKNILMEKKCPLARHMKNKFSWKFENNISQEN